MKAPEKTWKWKGTLPHLCLQPLFSNVVGVKRVNVEFNFQSGGWDFTDALIGGGGWIEKSMSSWSNNLKSGKESFSRPTVSPFPQKWIFIVVCIRRVEVIWRRIYQPWRRCVSIQLKKLFHNKAEIGDTFFLTLCSRHLFNFFSGTAALAEPDLARVLTYQPCTVSA
jgi:hypothetical protein